MEGEVKAEIALALNVYYNDDITSYFSNESGNAIVVSEDGTYTLSFDCDKDLSQNAIASGVSSLSNLTAIYIKDDSVTKGTHKKSPLLSCDIVYDKIKIDGTDFEVMKKESKSALKASGILDTNDPINSWDGSVIEEVNVKNHVLNFTNIEEPKKIEITFTLSNLVFEDGAVAIEKDKAESIEMIKETSLLVTEENPLLLSVKVSPLDCGKVVFVSDRSEERRVGKECRR